MASHWVSMITSRSLLRFLETTALTLMHKAAACNPSKLTSLRKDLTSSTRSRLTSRTQWALTKWIPIIVPKTFPITIPSSFKTKSPSTPISLTTNWVTRPRTTHARLGKCQVHTRRVTQETALLTLSQVFRVLMWEHEIPTSTMKAISVKGARSARV